MYEFWCVMAPVILVQYFICFYTTNDKAKALFLKWSLLFLSLILLGLVSAETLLIFLAVTITAFIFCYYAQNKGKKTKLIILCILIPLLLTPLLYYKYADFIFRDILQREWSTFRDLIIPIGISFYTFQTISFCLDTLRSNQPVPKFIDFMNFCSFFPQIVAGPIERRDNLLPQMENLHMKLSAHTLYEGIPYVVLGIFFKIVLADNLATGMWRGYEGTNALLIWANNICFGFRIYFDFAGYGLSAYGLAKCLGITITMNFQSPYTCFNISDFWRNWHISLTQWFRDYIYFAIGGSRTRFWSINIIFMFLVSGIWHGAGWNFIIWGTLSGVAMVIHRYYRALKFSLPSPINWMLTFGTMMFIWMFFYETDMSILSKNFTSIFNYQCYNLYEFIQLLKNNVVMGSCMIFFIGCSIFIIILEYISRKKRNNPYNIFLSPTACMLMIIAICALHPQTQSNFIYFAF